MENKQQDNKKKRKIGLLVGLVAGIPAAVATATTLAVVIPSLMPTVEDKDVEVGQTEWFADFDKKEQNWIGTFDTFLPTEIEYKIDGVSQTIASVQNFSQDQQNDKTKTSGVYLEDIASPSPIFATSVTLETLIGQAQKVTYLTNYATKTQKIVITTVSQEYHYYVNELGYITEYYDSLNNQTHTIKYLTTPHPVTEFYGYKNPGAGISYDSEFQVKADTPFTITFDVLDSDGIKKIYSTNYSGTPIDLSNMKIYLTTQEGTTEQTGNWEYDSTSKEWNCKNSDHFATGIVKIECSFSSEQDSCFFHAWNGEE